MFGRADVPDDQDMPPMDVAYQNITDKYNQARDVALSNGYDALFTVESDMILPPLTLERLTRIETDVAYGLYVSRHGEHPWLCAEILTQKRVAFLSTDEEWRKAEWGGVVESQGLGMGCTLTWRHVLEKIPFRYDSGRGGWRGQDWYFALDVDNALFDQHHDLGVVCGHINRDNKRIYWPDPNALGGYVLEYLDPSQLITIKPGEKVELEMGRFGSEEIMMVRP
jgi:hypothetical protein